MENCIEDYESAQLLRELILHRMVQEAEADRPGLGISVYAEGDGTRYEFLVGNSRFLRIRARFEVDGAMGDCDLLLMSGYSTPAAHITIRNNFIWYGGRSEGEYPTMIGEVETRLREGFVPPKLNMLYGFVEDGTVTAMCYANLVGGEVPGAVHAVMADFALQEHELPLPFLVRPIDPTGYPQIFGEFMQAGQIVELSQRAVNHPGSLWFYSSGVDWPHLMFNGSDGQYPLLPAHTPYLRRLASERLGATCLSPISLFEKPWRPEGHR